MLAVRGMDIILSKTVVKLWVVFIKGSYMKFLTFLFLILVSNIANSGCLDNLTSSGVIVSKIKGFYINRDNQADQQRHNVILDKATCTASQSGDVALAPVTKEYYYLSFRSADKTLWASLLSAQARDTLVEFRISNPIENSNVNAIAYVITPAYARAQ